MAGRLARAAACAAVAAAMFLVKRRPAATEVPSAAAPAAARARPASESAEPVDAVVVLELLRERDQRWSEIRRRLASKNSPAADKQRLAVDFYKRFHASPGLRLADAAELARSLPPGAAKDDVLALAGSPVGREAAARLRLKTAASARVADALKLPFGPERHQFLLDCPINKNGWFVEVRRGEPARDRRGNLIFKYRRKAGETRVVSVPAAVLKDGSSGDAAIEKAAEAVADDFLKIH